MPNLSFPTVRLFGLEFVSDTSIQAIAESLVRHRDEPVDAWRSVVTPNVDHLVRYRRYPSEAMVGERAHVVLPDGMPIVWASKLLGRPLRARLPGSDLFATLWPMLVEHAIPTVVVASNAVVARRLSADQDEVRCIVPPFFDVDDEPAVTSIIDEIDERVREIGARFVIVGVSMPKHHLIASRLHERWSGRFLGKPVVLLLGASPDLALGLMPRAPMWMQRGGVEWLYRLAREPRRLAKRYLVDDVAFVGLVWKEWRKVSTEGSRLR